MMRMAAYRTRDFWITGYQSALIYRLSTQRFLRYRTPITRTEFVALAKRPLCPHWQRSETLSLMSLVFA